jgi:hypothetical protein
MSEQMPQGPEERQLDFEKMSPVEMQALYESQKQEIDELKAKVEALETQFSALTSEADVIETDMDREEPAGVRRVPVTGTNQPRVEATKDKKERSFFRKRTAILLAVGAAAIGGATFALFGNGDDKEKVSAGTPIERTANPSSEKHAGGTTAGSNTSGSTEGRFPSNRLMSRAGVGEAMHAIKSGSITEAKANVKKIAKAPEVSVSHFHGQQAHTENYTAENTNLANAIEAVAISRNSDDGNVRTTWNNLHGRALTSPLPESTSVEEARKWVLNKMSSESTDFRFRRMSGSFENAGQKSENQVFSQIQSFNDVKFLEMTLENGRKAYFKVGGGNDETDGTCWNDNRPVKITVNKPGKNIPNKTTHTPKTPNGIVKTPEDKKTPKTPVTPKTPMTPETPKNPECPPGYKMDQEVKRCLHPKADGPPPEANQKPRPQPGTPGYKPGNAEDIDKTQHGDPKNLDPTPHGTEVPDSMNGGKAPGGGDSSVVTKPGEGAQDNPNHVPGSESNGSNAGTNGNALEEETQTGGTNQTSGAGSDAGGF